MNQVEVSLVAANVGTVRQPFFHTMNLLQLKSEIKELKFISINKELQVFYLQNSELIINNSG